jgi:hypothetical protein
MTPIWLMGEAIVPGAKVGGTFKKGTKKLFSVAEELRDALMTSSYAIHKYFVKGHKPEALRSGREDVVVILDKHFKLNTKGTANDTNVDSGSKDKFKSSGFDEQSRRAAEVIRAAGYVSSLIKSVGRLVTNKKV